MRTTLDIDDDVLQAAKDLARRKKKTAGEIISELARQALGATPLAPPRRRRRRCTAFARFRGVVAS